MREPPAQVLVELRRFVSEAHAEQISGLADDPNVPLNDPFLHLLPWVIAFGCGEQWAQRFDQNIRAATDQRGYYAPVRAAQIGAARSAAASQASSAGAGGASGVGSGGAGGGAAHADRKRPRRPECARTLPHDQGGTVLLESYRDRLPRACRAR